MLDIWFETDRFGNIDCLVPGSHGPSVRAIAFKSRRTSGPVYNVHNIAKGGPPIPCMTVAYARRIMRDIAKKA